LKKLLLILLISCSTCYCVVGQTDTTIPPQITDTTTRLLTPDTVPKPVKRRVVREPVKRPVVSDTATIRDSIKPADSVAAQMRDSFNLVKPFDSSRTAASASVTKKPIDSFYLKLLDNPFLKTKAKPIYLVINERQRNPKDEMFYLLAGLLLFLAFIKLVFKRYFNNVFKLFLQPSFRQKQTREQLQHSNLPSLLLNLFFIFSGAAYISLLIEYYDLSNINFWSVLLYTCVALLVLYVGKFILLTFAGWVFNAKGATESYIFSVYLINKIMGVILVPFTLVIAFSPAHIINVSITISLLLLLLLFIYRYIVSYGPVRKEVKLSPLHFFFYIFAFEITPLLLIYKTLIIYLDKSL
jgi:hypothetical protein